MTKLLLRKQKKYENDESKKRAVAYYLGEVWEKKKEYWHSDEIKWYNNYYLWYHLSLWMLNFI